MNKKKPHKRKPTPMEQAVESAALATRDRARELCVAAMVDLAGQRHYEGSIQRLCAIRRGLHAGDFKNWHELPESERAAHVAVGDAAVRCVLARLERAGLLRLLPPKQMTRALGETAYAVAT